MKRAGAIFALGLLACVPQSRSDVCPVPAGATEASALLQGLWEVRRASGEIDGTISFDASRVQAASGATALSGNWEMLGSTAGSHTVRLVINSAQEGTVHQAYGEPDEIQLVLMFGGDDLLFALQDSGVWTRWTRLGNDPVLPPSPSSVPMQIEIVPLEPLPLAPAEGSGAAADE